MFGTPKEMTTADIDDVVRRFAKTARLAADAGFAGAEIHAAHGYLLTQFMSATTNKRTDAYGGSAAARVKIVVDIIRAVRAEVPNGFCIGIKVNSVDHQSKEALRDCIEQLKLIEAAGIDFVEISGGSYEDPQARHFPEADPGGMLTLETDVHRETRSKVRPNPPSRGLLPRVRRSHPLRPAQRAPHGDGRLPHARRHRRRPL
jgi:2,4-dienoyl-CoA reductase-like NADH-dependent reductase (Old Yellow Enzyme family)